MSNIPHQAIINVSIQADICEKLPNGQVSWPKRKIRPKSHLFTVTGNSYEECEEKVNSLLANLARRINGEN